MKLKYFWLITSSGRTNKFTSFIHWAAYKNNSTFQINISMTFFRLFFIIYQFLFKFTNSCLLNKIRLWIWYNLTRRDRWRDRSMNHFLSFTTLTSSVMKQLSLSISHTARPPLAPNQLSLRSNSNTLVFDCKKKKGTCIYDYKWLSYS